MRSLAEILDGSQRVGLITSAWHMPRALRLARANGLNPIPVPADFVSPPQHDRPIQAGEVALSMFPDEGNMSKVGVLLREVLAGRSLPA